RAVGAEPRPRDGPAQRERGGDDARLLLDLPHDARHGILAWLQLPAEAVVLALVVVAVALAVDEQDVVAATDVGEGADDGAHHVRNAAPGRWRRTASLGRRP